MGKPVLIRLIFTIFSCIFLSNLSLAQSTFIPIQTSYQHLVERYEIKSEKFSMNFHTHLKPYARKNIASLADSIWSNLPRLSPVDHFNINYLKNDNWEWSETAQNDSKKPVFNVLYKKKSDFYHVRTPDFDLHINPVFHGFAGYEKDQEETPYLNTRGVEVRGILGKKVGFYSYLTDSQGRFPQYVTDEITQLNAIPNEGFYKRDIGGNGVDFITARGYITLDVLKDVTSLQFGYDKNFIGSGYRSMILSDYSSNYLFLKLNTNVWKLNYQNIFAQLTADVFNGDSVFPTKYFALHHLSLNLTKNFNIGFFESVVFNRGDTLNNNQGNTLDLRYLNPVIFYRSIEQQAGSPDNANLGMDFKWYFANHFSLYGQLLIDEFVLSEIRNGNGWRGNKQAGQIGLKYIDVGGISNLDLQAEVNIARPYTYSHNFKYVEYSNYNQPLAHPLGANFYEYIGILRYQPLRRLNLTGKLIYADYGTDEGSSNFGKNIFLNNVVNSQEFGNSIAQGIQTKLLFIDFTASWQLRHNLFFDWKSIYRQVDSALDARDKDTFFTSLAVRWNIPQRLYEF